MYFNELNSFQGRSLVDLRQVYEAWKAADEELRHRFAGSMRWRRKNGKDYLFRKIGSSEKGLGSRSPETERTYANFKSGREKVRERLSGLTQALDTQAAVARSVGLGRVPILVARLLRALDEANALGHLRIVGTNALFAYEALASVRVSADALATTDVDLLLDARRRLRFVMEDGDQRTVIGLLQRIDRSFSRIPGKPYRVVNADGFMVDLIRPETKPPWKEEPGSGALAPDDLLASPIEGLQWLVNAPALSTIVIDERGYPSPIVAPDPRIWLLHKRWLSERQMREPEKKRRDRQQAEITLRLIQQNLPQYPLDAEFVSGLPAPLREAFQAMQPPSTGLEAGEEEYQPPKPRW